MSNANELDDFLGHTSRDRGAGVNRLGNWKKRETKSVMVALHTRAAPVALWQHGLARVVKITKDDITRYEAWGTQWNCIEPEPILKKQYFRDKVTKEREKPPTICPVCLLVEWVRRMVNSGQLKFCEPLFKWVGDDESKARVITAAGIFNGYNAKDLTKAQKEAMVKASVRKSVAWMENAYAKCNYVFTVVDVENPDDGVQIATETTLVGDKTKEVIRDAKMALGDEEGNPLLHPYAIRWEHRPDEREFNKKYKALRMEKVVITGEISKLIIDEDPPDRSRIIAPGNVRQLRADLEAHALVDIPWDDIFGPAEQAQGIDYDAEQAEVAAQDIDDDEFNVDGPAPSVKGSDAGDDDPEEEEEEEGIECNICKAEMADDEFTCEKCGTEYDKVTGEITKRGKVPKRGRKKKAKSKKATPPPPSEPSEPPPSSSGSGTDWAGDDDDDIPF